jgi:hypothetical protein
MSSESIIHKSEYGSQPNNFHVAKRDDTLYVELTYPNIATPEQCRFIYVNQESVRASDGIRLHYDYDRDGWVVEQASKFSWSDDDEVCDPDWQEVAFIESWARQSDDDEQ